MSDDEQRAEQVFLQVHEGLPRQGPGSQACTWRALDLVGPLPPSPRVLDIGCGPGMQTLDLAERLPTATITAVDLLPGFVQEARSRVLERGLSSRVDVQSGDMKALGFSPGSFDLIWCEGAAYIMGMRDALQAWAPLLREQGRVALTEVAWLGADRPAALESFWREVYPPMTDIDGCTQHVTAAGLTPIDHFVLPGSAWWDDYYTPLEARVESLTVELATDPVAGRVLQEYRDELAMYREHGSHYGYVFFVMKRS
ncbi:MAG: class I SAM-dependent methyltransferase [Deltaproteobacteria bacterium]|nr:class I SAM-dependent methyltransferase [Deltaproteobacteria bacterium]